MIQLPNGKIWEERLKICSNSPAPENNQKKSLAIAQPLTHSSENPMQKCHRRLKRMKMTIDTSSLLLIPLRNQMLNPI